MDKNIDLRPDLAYEEFIMEMAAARFPINRVPGKAGSSNVSSPQFGQGGTTFSGFSTSGPLTGTTKYPAPLGVGDYIDPEYINAMVKAHQDLVESLQDKINAMQERIELLEDDVNES